ncbi:lytic transglycosylase F [Ramlibacter sp. PS3R-8]|uniref:transglycosylase SLT domain-containing protein n=1 Tax=Ramlibacter sp. PS3R-8 TaxID=3133437 RepID=UPI00309AC32B
MIVALSSVASSALAKSQPSSAPARAPTVRVDSVKEDLDGLIKHRTIRVAVPFSRTLYFNDKGRERGISADFVRDFERWLNEKHKKDLRNRPVTLMIRPTTRDKLLTEVMEGRADIAVGNLTVTDERLKLVDFAVAKDQKPIAELVVSGPRSGPLADADALSGQTVHVRKASSYYESLKALNERFNKNGRPAANLVLVPDALEDEDMMEMLNAGLLEMIVVDDWKARMWAQVLPKIHVNEGAVVRSGGKVGWAIRKGSPRMKAELAEFYVSYVKRQGIYNQRMKSYSARIKQLNNPAGESAVKRFEQTLALFQKYGTQYQFEPLMLAALGYQESQLDQNAKSRVGAIGIMQVMPATGAELNVGSLYVAESNVHAGTKYMDQLMRRHLADAKLDDTNRTLFAFAAYNCGPGNVRRMRREAEARGIDPNRWFNNVELVTAEKIGSETTTYVRNIFKYYVAYKLMTDVGEAQRKARESVQPRK